MLKRANTAREMISYNAGSKANPKLLAAFEKWATLKGMSISKNQSEGIRYSYYHNWKTKQAWKLWQEIAHFIAEAYSKPQT